MDQNQVSSEPEAQGYDEVFDRYSARLDAKHPLEMTSGEDVQPAEALLPDRPH